MYDLYVCWGELSYVIDCTNVDDKRFRGGWARQIMMIC